MIPCDYTLIEQLDVARGDEMDPNGFLYAATMTDLLATAVPKDEWDKEFIPPLGPLSRLFAHLIRVRDIYRDGLLMGSLDFSRTHKSKIFDLESELVRSRTELAAAIANPKFHEIRFGDILLTSYDVYGAAIQHEGIHQGQWYVSLKQAGYEIPLQWQLEWNL